MATTRQQSRSTTRKPTSRSRSASRSGSTSRKRPAPAPTPSGPSTASKLAKPALAGSVALAGIVGGALLRTKATRKRRFPVSIGNPLDGFDAKKARKQVGNASKQFGAFTRELRKAGEQAERIGDALS